MVGPTHATLRRRSLAAALTFALLAACAGTACRKGPVSAQTALDPEAPPSPGTYDPRITDSARVLAGLSPFTNGAHAEVVKSEKWKAWQAEVGERWKQAREARFDPARAWGDGALKGSVGDCRTVMYPFSGADILTPYLLVPGCEGYVLVGTEPAGELPSLDGLTPEQLEHVFGDLRRGLRAVFPRGGAPDARAPAPSTAAGTGGIRGAFPVLAVQLARLNAKIIGASRFDISADGRPMEPTPVTGSSSGAPGLTITFEVPGGRPQALVYFPGEVDDAALRRRPGLWTFLRLQAPFVSYLKAASPLQGERYSLVRDLLLKQSSLVVQDEAGIPVPMFRPVDWSVTAHRAVPTTTSPDGTARLVAFRKKPR
jgi:hypothetical protein